jgi:hypothetical protein
MMRVLALLVTAVLLLLMLLKDQRDSLVVRRAEAGA